MILHLNSLPLHGHARSYAKQDSHVPSDGPPSWRKYTNTCHESTSKSQFSIINVYLALTGECECQYHDSSDHPSANEGEAYGVNLK